MEHLDLLPEGHCTADGRKTAAGINERRVFPSRFRRIGRTSFRTSLRLFTAFAYLWLLNILSSTSALAAGDIKGSKIVTGTEKLIGDVTTWLMILAPIVSGLLIIYFCIRRAAADEMDQKKWNNRIIVAIVSCIGAVLGSATLNIIIGYYK